MLSLLLAGCGGWGFAVSDNRDRRTPLEKAAQGGDSDAVRGLLSHGADPNERDGVFGSPLNAAASRNGNALVIRALIAAGAHPNGRGHDNRTCWTSPLWSSASVADLENTQALLDSGATVSQSSCSKLIVGWLKVPVIELLRRYGLDIFGVDEFGRNELHAALAPPTTPLFDSIEYLIRAGVPLNARDRNGKTPLAYWREPRDFEAGLFRSWLAEALSGDGEWNRQRDTRIRISRLLEQSGAAR